MILEIISSIFLLAGSVFFLISSIGILRFPDLYTRMHAATKGGAFGAVLMLMGVAVHFAELWISIEVLLVIIFIFLTAPVAGHMIGRAAYLLNTPLWNDTVIDEWCVDLQHEQSSIPSRMDTAPSIEQATSPSPDNEGVQRRETDSGHSAAKES